MRIVKKRELDYCCSADAGDIFLTNAYLGNYFKESV